LKSILFINILIFFLDKGKCLAQNASFLKDSSEIKKYFFYQRHDSTLPGIDSLKKFFINEIIFIGNFKSKKSILLRELDLKKGDSVSLTNLHTRLENNKNRIFNTGLFIYVKYKVFFNKEHQSVDICFFLKERFYIFPLPIFELGDRSFNEWWYQRGKDIRRINYGIHFEHKNFRGLNERLKFIWQHGFTPKYEVAYFIPYLNKKQKSGLGTTVQYALNKQIAVNSNYNKQVFLKSDNQLRTTLMFELNYVYRSGFFTRHYLYLRHKTNTIADTVSKINPNYFGNQQTKQQFFEFSYLYNYDSRNMQVYATEGTQFQMILDKTGILKKDNLNLTRIVISYSKYYKIFPKSFLNFNNRILWTNHPNVPYFNLKSLGFQSNYIRGYDLYVIDGVSYAYTKTTLKYNFLQEVVQVKSKMLFNQFKTIPISSFITLYYDIGYAYNPLIQDENKRLLNKLLNGFGIGLDIVSFYDTSIRFEYSFNQFMEKGLYFYISSDLK